MADGCISCGHNAEPDLPLRERIVLTEHWRVAHAFDTAVRGWLVVVAREHLTSLADLSPAAAAELGPLLAALTGALQRVVGAERSYVALFAEADGYAHLHLHVVPRLPDQPAELRGPSVFAALGVSDEAAVPVGERDELARRLAAAVSDVR